MNSYPWFETLARHEGRDSWALVAIDAFERSRRTDRDEYITALLEEAWRSVDARAAPLSWSVKVLCAVCFEILGGDRNRMVVMTGELMKRGRADHDDVQGARSELSKYGIEDARLRGVLGEAAPVREVAVAEVVSPNSSGSLNLGRADVAILTILNEEYSAVHQRMQSPEFVSPPNRFSWHTSSLRSSRGLVYRLALGRSQSQGPGSMLAAGLATWDRFRPRVLVVLGVAGGLKEVRLGDVVVANHIDGFEYGKVTDGSFQRRHEWDRNLAGGVTTSVEGLPVNVPRWADDIRASMPRGRFEGEASDVAIMSGPVGSGDKVMDDLSASISQALLSASARCLAIEMEAVGAGIAIRDINDRGEDAVTFAMVRGISDLPLSDRSDDISGGTLVRDEWKAFASDAAAAALFASIEYQWPFQPLEVDGN